MSTAKYIVESLMKYIENIGFWQVVALMFAGCIGVTVIEILMDMVFNYFSGHDEPEKLEEEKEERTNDEEYLDSE